MSKKKETIRLPIELLTQVDNIAALAKVPVDTVIAVILAADIVRMGAKK